MMESLWVIYGRACFGGRIEAILIKLMVNNIWNQVRRESMQEKQGDFR